MTAATLPELLRHIADLVEDNPTMPRPDIDNAGRVSWFTAHTPDQIAAVLRAVPGPWIKNDPNASAYDWAQATFTTTFHGHQAQVCANRAQVCTRKVIGTREVVEVVPVTSKAVTITQDIVEWDCHSVLAEATR